MLRRVSRRLTSLLCLPLALALLTPLSGCNEGGETRAPTADEDEVDALARQLLAALAADDAEAARALSNQELSIALDLREVAIIARTLAWLGTLESLSGSDEEPLANGVRRRYVARFARGELTWHLSVVGGKAEGFELDPGQWAAYEERALTAHAGSMRLLDFHFVGPEGQPVQDPVDPSSIPYALELEGLDVQFREHHVSIGKKVYDAEGNEVYRQDSDDNITFPQGEDGTSGGILTGSVKVPGPGSYELELRIRDLAGGQDITHRVEFEIAEAPAE